MGGLHAQAGGRISRAQAVAVPDFALHVFGLAKQGGPAVAGDHQKGFGFTKAAEVIKVAVVPVQKVGIAVALLLRRGRDDGDAFGPEQPGQVGAALRIEGGGGGRGAIGVGQGHGLTPVGR